MTQDFIHLMVIKEGCLPTITIEVVFIEGVEAIILDLTMIKLKIALLITKDLMMSDIKSHLAKVVIKSIQPNTIRNKRLMNQLSKMTLKKNNNLKMIFRKVLNNNKRKFR